MKKLVFLLVCCGLILPGSGFIGNLNAQTANAREAANSRVKNSGKVVSAAKLENIKKIAKNRIAAKTGSVTGDPCNETAPITVGQTINGSLSAEDCVLDDDTSVDFYSFNGTAGQPIFLTYNSSDGGFDPLLFLLDSDGFVITSNDDSNDTLNSRIPEDLGVFTLPYTGEYIVAANQYEPGTGNYALSLGTDATCAATTIAYNQTVNGTFALTDCVVGIQGAPYYTDIYKFNATAGQQISISLTSTVNTYLLLRSPSGDQTEEDPSGTPATRIPVGSGLLTLAETGTYTFEASTFNAAQTGSYTLVLTGPNVNPPARTAYDYDGDGKADLSVFRPSNATWYISSSSNNAFNAAAFGVSTDVIAPADFDGDGRTDISVFRPSTGEWFRLNSANNTFSSITFGQNGDIPVAADYDGDGKADISVFRNGGNWYRINSSNNSFFSIQFGVNGDRPAIGDFDGDGKADISVYSPLNGGWYRINSSDNSFFLLGFGVQTDKIVPADYDGDGKTDLAVYRSGVWYRLASSNNTVTGVQFGTGLDTPVPADYDGDGKADLAVFRPADGTWYQLRTTSGFAGFPFGVNNDIPVPSSRVR